MLIDDTTVSGHGRRRTFVDYIDEGFFDPSSVRINP